MSTQDPGFTWYGRLGYLTHRLVKHHEEYASMCALWYSTIPQQPGMGAMLSMRPFINALFSEPVKINSINLGTPEHVDGDCRFEVYCFVLQVQVLSHPLY